MTSKCIFDMESCGGGEGQYESDKIEIRFDVDFVSDTGQGVDAGIWDIEGTGNMIESSNGDVMQATAKLHCGGIMLRI